MALELKIGTSKAEQNLARVGEAIAVLETKLNQFGAASGAVDKSIAALAAIKPVPTSVIASIDKMNAAFGKLNSMGSADAAVKAISNLSAVNVSSATASIQDMSRALSSIQTPRGLLPLSRNLQSIAASAAPAAAGINQVAGAMSTLQANSGTAAIEQTARALRVKTAAATQASSAVNLLGVSLAGAGAVAAALGVTLGAIGISRLVQASYEAASSLDQASNKLNLVTGSAEGTKLALANIRDVAYSLAIPIGTAQKQFSTLANSATASGFSFTETQKVFNGFSVAFRALGLDTQQVERGFTAVSQIMSKNKIGAEELTQQLGELIPASSLLAQALGKSPAELADAMQKGSLSARELLPLADSLVEKFGGAIPGATNTLQAAMTNLGSASSEALTAMGKGLAAAIPGVNSLIDTLKSPEFIKFSETMGNVIGQALNVAAIAAGVLASALAAIVEAIGMVLQPIIDAAKWLFELTGAFTVATDATNKFGTAANATANPVAGMTQRTMTAAEAVDKLRDAAGISVPALGAAGKAADRTGDDYQKLRRDANDAADAISRLNSIAASQNKYGEWSDFGGSEISDYSYSSSSSSDFETQSYSGGGIVGSATRFAPARASWFTSAPHFAGGGTTTGMGTRAGGGIPAILHANEAVVPLTGGGAIPVAGGGGGFAGPLASTLVNLTRDQNIQTARVWEQVNVLAVLTQQGIDRTATLLEKLNVSLGTLNTSLTNAVRVSSSSSSSSGSAYDRSEDSSVPGDWASMGYVDRLRWLRSQQDAMYGTGPRDPRRSGGGIQNSGFHIDEDGRAIYAISGGRLGSPNLYDDPLRKFRMGSPNAETDIYGGFTAMLHPDEAVIPLPDGRSVPVTFPTSFMDRMTQADDRRDRDRDSRQGGKGDTVYNIKLEMTVNAKDADSFRKSQGQLLQDLQRDVDRATRNLGRQSGSDDPTKRPA